MAGILSKGIKLEYKASSASSYTEVANIQAIPDLGGAPEQVEVTTLADSSRKYISGIKSTSQLEFTVLFDATEYAAVSALSGEYDWKITLYDDSSSIGTFTFSGQPACRLNGAGVNEALTYTLTIDVNSDIVFA